MGRRRLFDNVAKRAWWQLHIDAQKKSGLTIARYCRQHRLKRWTFTKWRRELVDWEEQKTQQKLASRRRHQPISPDKRRQATQAFWAMHVEAWQWSGLHLRDYSAALRLSPHSLKRWRNLIEAEEVESDWRALLHPSARPPISTNISTRTDEAERIQSLKAEIDASAGPPKRATRRRLSLKEKIALLLEAERHGETISSVGRRHGILTSVLFRWRDQRDVARRHFFQRVADDVLDIEELALEVAPLHQQQGRHLGRNPARAAPIDIAGHPWPAMSISPWFPYRFAHGRTGLR